MSTSVKYLSSILQSTSTRSSSSPVNSTFNPSTAIFIPLPGQPTKSANMEGVKEEPLSQKNNLKDQPEMLPPPTPKSSAPRASSPQKAGPEIQVKPSQPSREVIPPTSDAFTPPSAQIVDEDAEDDETDQDPTQEAQDDETMHDLQAYDWSKLEEEYEAAMAQCDEREKEAIEEFKKLANVSFWFYEVKIVRC